MSNLEKDILELLYNAKNGEYTIFYVSYCPYCNSSLDLLKKNKLVYKAYDISKYGFAKLLNIFRTFKNDQIINFNINHTTKPIIFFNGKFLGGYTELKTKLQN